MYRLLATFVFVLGFVMSNIQSAEAQTFVTNGRTTTTEVTRGKTAFDQNFQMFYQDLSETSDRMNLLRTLSENSAANRFFTHAMTNRADTAEQLQRSFMNSEIHASNSGGTYNTPVRTNSSLVLEQF